MFHMESEDQINLAFFKFLEKVVNNRTNILPSSVSSDYTLMLPDFYLKSILDVIYENNLFFDVYDNFTYKDFGILGYILANSIDLKNFIDVFIEKSFLLINVKLKKYYILNNIYIFFLKKTRICCLVFLCIQKLLKDLFGNGSVMISSFFSGDSYSLMSGGNEPLTNYLSVKLNKNTINKRKIDETILKSLLFKSEILAKKTMFSNLIDAIKKCILLKKIKKLQISQELKIKPRYLDEILKQNDTNFREITNIIKHDIAKELLKNENLSVLEISALLSFKKESSFIRMFKIMEGQTPLQFKKEKKSK